MCKVVFAAGAGSKPLEFGAQIHHNMEQEKKVAEIAFVEKFHISNIAKTFYGVYICI